MKHHFFAVVYTNSIYKHKIPTADGLNVEVKPFLVDLESVRVNNKDKIVVVDFNHDEERPLGFATIHLNYDWQGDKCKLSLTADGTLDDEDSDGFAKDLCAKMKSGLPYGMSPVFNFIEAERIEVGEGEKVFVNRTERVGPFVLFKNAPLLGVSITPFPTDCRTSATLLLTDCLTYLSKEKDEVAMKPEKESVSKEEIDEENPSVVKEADPEIIEPEIVEPEIEDEKNVELTAEQTEKTYLASEIDKFVARFGAEEGLKYLRDGVEYIAALETEFDRLKANESKRAQIEETASEVKKESKGTGIEADVLKLKADILQLKSQIDATYDSEPNGVSACLSSRKDAVKANKEAKSFIDRLCSFNQ